MLFRVVFSSFHFVLFCRSCSQVSFVEKKKKMFGAPHSADAVDEAWALHHNNVSFIDDLPFVFIKYSRKKKQYQNSFLSFVRYIHSFFRSLLMVPFPGHPTIWKSRSEQSLARRTRLPLTSPATPPRSKRVRTIPYLINEKSMFRLLLSLWLLHSAPDHSWMSKFRWWKLNQNEIWHILIHDQFWFRFCLAWSI